MKAVFLVALAIHILSVLGVLALLLTQASKSPRVLKGGVLHTLLTALVAGFVMMGLFHSVNPDETLNGTKFAIKGAVITVLLILGYKNVKKPALSTAVWGSMIGLTVLNILIASLWK
jgi:hypothetical protein